MKTILGIGGFVVLVALVMMLQRLLGRGAAMVSGAVTGNKWTLAFRSTERLLLIVS